MTPNEMLDLRFDCDDLDGEVSIREYMKALLAKLFDEGESFSGKRPFGNSGWEYDIIAPLIRAGAVKGSLDDDGLVEAFNKDDFQLALGKMIAAL